MTLSARGLSYRIGDRLIVDDIDLDARAGGLLALAGPSGAGKSTVLGLLGGLLAPSAGSVTLDDTPVRTGDLALRRRVGLILQGYGLVTALTGRENVAVTLQARRLDRAEVADRADAVLAAVGLTEVADHLVDDMSGGQQQRVAVARALVSAPEILLADEPTSELDADNRERIVALFTAHARTGATVVIASHDPDVVDVCDDVVHLEAGRVVVDSAHTGA